MLLPERDAQGRVTGLMTVRMTFDAPRTGMAGAAPLLRRVSDEREWLGCAHSRRDCRHKARDHGYHHYVAYYDHHRCHDHHHPYSCWGY